MQQKKSARGTMRTELQCDNVEMMQQLYFSAVCGGVKGVQPVADSRLSHF